jgi:hypothetical protein
VSAAKVDLLAVVLVARYKTATHIIMESPVTSEQSTSKLVNVLNDKH